MTWPFRSRLPVEERVMVWIHGRGEAHGADIADGLMIGSGTLYPALMKLEKLGILESRWEDDTPPTLGQPRRRFYRIADADPREESVAGDRDGSDPRAG